MELSIYIHFPFCVKRCNYCDFNTFAGKENLISDYISALAKEIQFTSKRLNPQYPVHTIYFGGGTPSLMQASDTRRIIRDIKNSFDLLPDPEITLEANPGTVDHSKLDKFREIGINRLSFGVQSFQMEELKVLGRIHTPEQAEKAFLEARQCGFENINLDLIFGLPGQTLEKWQATLQTAWDLNPTHLSLYSLLVEPGTLLETQIRSGRIPTPDEDLAAEMYEQAMNDLQSHGFLQYEISNWSRLNEMGKSWTSRHNLQYWKNYPYLGIGAGAHGSIPGRRTENVRQIETYIRKTNDDISSPEWISPANEKITIISKWEEIQETMMLGLRLTEQGVIDDEFLIRFGNRMEEYFPDQITKLVDQKLLEWNLWDKGRALRLTRKGRLLGNRVFSEFVGNDIPGALDQTTSTFVP